MANSSSAAASARSLSSTRHSNQSVAADVSPRLTSASLQLGRKAPVAPRRAKRQRRRWLRHWAGCHLVRQLDPGLFELPTRRNLQIAVRRQPRFISATVRTKSLLRRHVTRATIRQLHYKRERELARLLSIQSVLHEIF